MADCSLAHNCGVEALFFDRYMRFLLLLFGSSALVLTPVLSTFNYFLGSPGTSLDILDRLSWSSLVPDRAEYYWIYAALVPCFAGYTLVQVDRELRKAVSLRQRLLENHHEQATN